MAEVIEPLPRTETLRVIATVLGPLAARGLILRRQRTVGLLERIDADARAIALLRRLRDRYGSRPLRLRLPGREIAIVVCSQDACRILDGPPEEFVIANREKRAALRRFQPHGVLLSDASERPPRRRFNEQILDTGCARHRLAKAFEPKLKAETAAMLCTAAEREDRLLTWETFAWHWWRLARAITLGEEAADDTQLTDLLAKLRAAANWAYLAPQHRRARRQLSRRLREHLARAEPGSLAELIALARAPADVHAEDQVAHWLFAFDGAAMATFRALALVHSTLPRRAGAGGSARDPESPLLPYLLESLRLWPTTPAILRDAAHATVWDGRTLPAGIALIIYTPLLHRDPQILHQPDALHPELWAANSQDPSWAFPFSQGPGACPGRDLVTLVATTVLDQLADATEPCAGTALRDAQPFTATLSPFRLRFAVNNAKTEPARS